MKDGKKPTEYPLPDNLPERHYRVFPSDLEDDPLVLFHGTARKNLDPILAEGFRLPDPKSGNPLISISFAKCSRESLALVMDRRWDEPEEYCIIAVRYLTLKRDGITENRLDIHDYVLDPQPEILGYCIIPASYVHR